MIVKLLFDTKFTTKDPELRHLLTNDRFRDFLNDLWAQYSPFVADQKSFIAGLSEQPFTRIWEMYLGCALAECGLTLESKDQEGPDIKICNPSVWVEAVASTDGNKINQTIQPAARVPEVLLSGSMWGGPPEDEIISRYTASINKKVKKFGRYLKKGIVDSSETCVVALNLYKTSFSQLDHQHTPNHIPLVVKALFGYGSCVLLQLFPRDGFSRPISLNHFDYEYRSHYGNSVRTDIFLGEEASTISALIVSTDGFWSWHNWIPSSLSESFTLIHNPLARNRLPKHWLKSGHEIWIEQGKLHKQVWKQGDIYRSEIFPLPYDLPAEIRAKLP